MEGAKRRLIIYINDELCGREAGNGPTRRGNKQKAEEYPPERSLCGSAPTKTVDEILPPNELK